VARDNRLSADRRAHANQNTLEEARTLQELACTNEVLGDQTWTSGAKKKCESEMGNLAHDLDEMGGKAKLSEEKAQRAMIDAARLADEPRAEQEATQMLERYSKLLIRTAKFKELCRCPKTALVYLRKKLASCVDHSNQEEERNFQLLPA